MYAASREGGRERERAGKPMQRVSVGEKDTCGSCSGRQMEGGGEGGENEEKTEDKQSTS